MAATDNRIAFFLVTGDVRRLSVCNARSIVPAGISSAVRMNPQTAMKNQSIQFMIAPTDSMFCPFSTFATDKPAARKQRRKKSGKLYYRHLSGTTLAAPGITLQCPAHLQCRPPKMEYRNSQSLSSSHSRQLTFTLVLQFDKKLGVLTHS